MKNVLKVVGLAAAFGGLNITVPNEALAGAHRFSANICNPDGSSANSMTYGVYGVWNSNTTPANAERAVYCGINLSNAPVVTSVKIVVFDRDATDNYVHGVANNVSCKVTLLAENGSPIYAENPNASASSGYKWDAWAGSSINDIWGYSTNSGYWSPWTLIYDPPDVSTAAIVVTCLIPEYQGGDYSSHVTAIEVNTSN
jgi:hypothetical protein